MVSAALVSILVGCESYLIPMLNRWRTFTVVGSAFPNTIAGLPSQTNLVPRREWEAYQSLLSNLGTEIRIPAFGDYGAAHPELIELDMRLIKPFAKLRYTTDEAWHIGKGSPVRTHGFGQYVSLCKELTSKSYFDGPDFSEGNRYIADCARGNASTDNLTTWVWVATNRHLTKVVNDLSKLHGFSERL
jgi:hypothetical protein